MFLIRGLQNTTAVQRQNLLALPIQNTAQNFNYARLLKDQILLEGKVGPQKGGIFGPKERAGGGFQVVTESGRFGSVKLVE